MADTRDDVCAKLHRGEKSVKATQKRIRLKKRRIRGRSSEARSGVSSSDR